VLFRKVNDPARHALAQVDVAGAVPLTATAEGVPLGAGIALAAAALPVEVGSGIYGTG